MLVGLVVAVGCDGGSSGDGDPTPPVVLPAPATGLTAGVATRPIDYPIGAPLGGYGQRHEGIFGNPLDGSPQPPEGEARPQGYTKVNPPSVGLHTRPRVQVLALSWAPEGEAEQTLVLAHTDATFTVEAELRRVIELVHERAGVDLSDRLVITSSHSHATPGPFWNNLFAAFTQDVYNPEVFERMAVSIADAIVEALAARVPARFGIGTRSGFDEADEVYDDRRSENDEVDLVTNDALGTADPEGELLGDGIPDGPIKDQRLTVFRVDHADGTPMALFFHFPMHGTGLGADNQYISGDVTVAVEKEVEKQIDLPLVVSHVQGTTGDIAPRRGGFAGMEELGRIAAPVIVDLWRATPTLDRVEGIESITSIQRQDRQTIGYDRPGVGEPYDRFDAPFGAVQCGALASLAGDLGADLPDGDNPFACLTRPASYTNPAVANLLARLIYPIIFDRFVTGRTDDLLLDVVTGVNPEGGPYEEPGVLFYTALTAARIRGVRVSHDGAPPSLRSIALAALPGEPTTPLGMELRNKLARRMPGTDFPDTWVVGYAQDHHGYILLKEDWVLGGSVETGINEFGPLHGEFVVDRAVRLGAHLATGAPAPPEGVVPAEDPVPFFPVQPFPSQAPGVVRQPEGIDRFDTAVLLFVGGDPVLDVPHLVLQRRDAGGAFVDVAVRGDRLLDESGPETMLFYEWDETRADTEPHLWSFHWETVADTPAGTYRFRGEGVDYDGGPARPGVPYFSGAPYAFVSSPFEVRPSQALTLGSIDLDPAALSLAIRYPPRTPDDDDNTPDFFRARPYGPSVASVSASVWSAGVRVATVEATTTFDGSAGGRVTLPRSLEAGSYRVEIVATDGHGNSGQASLDGVLVP